MTKKANATGMLLDGAFATEAIDTSGEIVDIAGMDISSLEEGEGVANYEHEGPTGNNGQEVVGKIIDVKKIFKESDCSNDRHRFFWNKIKLPLLYGVIRLADGAGHPGAISLAALVRDSVANGEPINCRFSIEGSTVARDGNRLTRTIARKCALTFKPANRSAVSGLLADPNAPAGFEKNPVQPEEKSDVAEIVESLARKAEDNPLSQKIGSWDATIDSDYLIKADSAGCADAAPSTLTGGAALQREDISRRVAMVSGAKAALRDYDFYRKEAGKADFVKFLKFRMPDADPEFVEHFADMVEDYRFKKAETDFPGDTKAKVFDPKPAKPTGTKPIFRDVDEKTRFIPVPARAASKAVRLVFPTSHPRLKTTTNVPLFQMVAGQDEHGRSKKYPTQMKETYFDPELGFLHTPHGSFKVNIPDEEEFNSILNSPAVQGPHDAAMKNWKVLNGLLEKGKLPPEIIMHASLFSGMSPSVAVHMQELAFSHLQDIMARGVDPTKPPDQGGPTERDAQEFYERTGTGGILPKYLHDYWAGPQGDATRIGSSAPGGEEGEEEEAGLVGQQKGLLYQRQKWYSVENYHRLHDALVQYIHEHGTDGRRIARTLQGHKNAAGSHEAKVKRTNKKHALEAVRRGLGHIDEKGDIHLTSKGHEYVAANSAPGYFDATGAPDVSGFAPKTIRYALGMMGAGNCLDEKTEALTQRGWVKGFELLESDIVLTKNANTNKLEWQKISLIHLLPDYDGDVVDINSRSFNAVTTPEHRWLVTSRGNSFGRGGVVKEKTSETLTLGADRIHRTGEYDGPATSALSPDEAEVLGWFLTDGYYKYKRNYGVERPNAQKYSPKGVYAFITQSKNGNPGKCDRIAALLNRVDPGVKNYLRKTGETVWKLGPALTTKLHMLAPDRTLTISTLLTLNIVALSRLKESMVLGDGSVAQHCKKWSPSRTLCSGRKEQIDSFQVLLTLLGKASSSCFVPSSPSPKRYESMGMRVPQSAGAFVAHEAVREYALPDKSNVKRYKSKQPMWCITVPNGFFVARRNGDVWVTGNCVVPDTHFIRHLFGLPMDAEIARAARETLGRDFKETKTYKEKPFAPNEFLKRVLWDEKRPDLLEAIDNYYVKHHPAFRYADRRFFGGAGNPQALFPGFWAHWLAIGPHEKAHGMNSRSFNGGTDHSAYWTVVNQVLAKHGLDMAKAEKTDESFVHATAEAHNDMHKALGPGAAMMFYYSHLVPMLLRHAAKNNHWDDPTREYSQEQIEHDVIKGEATLISLKKILDTLELKKADSKPLPPKPLPAEPAIHGGRAVMPGRLKVESGWSQGEFDLLGEDATHYHIKDPMTPAQTIRKVRKEMGQVVAPYKTLDDDIRIDSKVHTVKGLNDNPEQHELVHGMAMGGGIDSPVDDSRLGINGITSGWKKNARGENVYVKFTGDHNMAHPEFPEAWAEASYYDSAKNFWGLGEHVPVSVAVTHPTTGTHFAVIKGIEGAEHLSWENKAGRTVFSPLHQTSLLNAQSEGLLDKMHIMNLVNGNGDRHSGNWMFDKSGKIMLIDHGLSVPPPPRNHGRLLFPSYIGSYEDAANNVGNTTGKWPSTRRPVHPKAVDWVLGLDPAKLDALWQKHNMPERARHLGIGRLESIQQKLREDPAQSRMEVFERPELEVLDDLRD